MQTHVTEYGKNCTLRFGQDNVIRLEISHGYFTDQVYIYTAWAFLVHWQNLQLIDEEIKLGQAPCQCFVQRFEMKI